jgi:lipopolysaccharide export system permease protein
MLSKPSPILKNGDILIRLIDRYFIKEFIPPFFFSLFALTFILLMDQLFRLIDLFVRKGLAITTVLQILVYTLPIIISYTAPMAILVAIVMTFGRMSQDNEILAMKVSGLPFTSIARTPLIITFIFAGFLVVFNNFILPESNHRMRNLMLDVTRKRPAIRLPEGVFSNDFPGYTVYVGKKDERHSKLYDITVYDLRNSLMITAPRGELKDFEDNSIIQFILYDGELHQLLDETKYQRTRFSKQIINMDVNTDLIRKERTYRQEDELDIASLRTRAMQDQAEIDTLKADIFQLGTEAITHFVNGDIRQLDAARFKIEKKNNLIKGRTRKISRYNIEINKKISLAVACLLFVLIGAPLGYLFKKGGIAAILIGVLLFSLYYILVLAGEEFADRKNFPAFWAMWLPNILLGISGIYLFLCAEYERSPLKKLFMSAQ